MARDVLKSSHGKKTGGDGIAPKVLKTMTVTMKADHLQEAVENYLRRYYGNISVKDISEAQDGLFLVRFDA